MDRQTRMYDNFDRVEQRTIEEILNIVASSLEFTDTFLNGFNQQQDAVMKNFQSIRNICNQISDGIIDSWNKRSA